MCDPVTATLMMTAGTGLKAFGSWYQGAAQAKAARIQRDVAKSNVELLKQQADVLRADIPLIEARGAYHQTKLAEKEAFISGGQSAYFGVAGIDMASGSPAALAMATAAQAVTERGMAAAQTRLDVAGKLGQISQTLSSAASQAAQAYASEEAAIDARVAGAIGAGTALLTGAAKMGGKDFDSFDFFRPTPMASSTSI
jgi:hypothetical protein